MTRSWATFVLAIAACCADVRAQTADRWASAEALLWWTKSGANVIPLATTAPAASPAPIPAALGEADTTIVLGGTAAPRGMQSGARFTLGRWLSADDDYGVEANYFFVGGGGVSQSVASDGSFFLGNPFFDAVGNFPNVNYLANPFGETTSPGSANLTTSQFLQGAELSGVWLLRRTDRAAWRVVGGYRWLYVGDDLTLQTHKQNDDFFNGEFFDTDDTFQTRNNFHGAQLGLQHRWSRGNWFLDSCFKCAVGNTHQWIRIRGTTTTNVGNGAGVQFQIPVTTVPGGIFTQPTNLGDYGRNRFSVLPEVTFRFGAQLTPRWRAFVGYDFLYLTGAALASDPIDGTINSTQLVSFTGLPRDPLVGPTRPAPQPTTSDYWAQGVNLGFEFNW